MCVCVCVCVCVCMHMLTCVCFDCVLVLCFVAGYVFQFGEITLKEYIIIIDGDKSKY